MLRILRHALTCIISKTNKMSYEIKHSRYANDENKNRHFLINKKFKKTSKMLHFSLPLNEDTLQNVLRLFAAT